MNIFKASLLIGLVTLIGASSDVQAKSRFNFSLNIGPQMPYYYAPAPVPYYEPYYPVVREYRYVNPYPVYQPYVHTVCYYDPWGRPYNCHQEYY